MTISRATMKSKHWLLSLSLCLALFLIPFLFQAQSQAEEICPTVESEEALLGEEYARYFNAFENYVARESSELNRENATVYTIPIVYHIVHNNDALGSGDNIDPDFLVAQTEQLNNDFRKVMGTSGDGNGVDIEIQFCTATVDENGNTMAEPGVNRIDRNDRGWTAPPYGTPVLGCLLGVNLDYINNTIKPQSQWNPERYFNVWILDMECGVVGYAQFPEAPSLAGIGTGNGRADSDGVVMIPSAIGSTDMPFPGGGAYSQGKVLAHEVGHWLGLRHAWGDGNCSADDFCEDTPTTAGSNRGCPDVDSCPDSPGRDQVENQMDYTDDACRNMFTQCQKDRMRIVMGDTGEGSPRREILINSTACGAGVEPTCDDGIQNGDEEGVDCGGSVCPPCMMEPTCDDGIQNGDEEGVDCGGSDCPPCMMEPTCDDGIQNGDEEGVDCGGSDCPPCMIEPTCDDGIQNGDEEGVDCGGSDCPPCMMQTCDAPTGLFETNNTGTSVTLNWTAVAAANSYTVQGRQLGSSNWQLTMNSNTNSTTISNNIVNGVTYEWRVRSNCDDGNSDYSEIATFVAGDTGGEPTCDDGIQNGDEEGVDCGGSVCPPCMMEPTCDDGIQNGDEEGVDCGGSDCPPCMMEPTCDDGIQNGDEEGVDCGGSDCPPCMMETCDVPTGLFETNNTGTSVTLNWTAVAAANSYTVQGRQAGTTRWRLNQNSNTNSTTISNNIVSGVTYEWRVRSNCDDGNSDYSEIATFTAGASAIGGIENRGETIIEKALVANVYPSPTSDLLNIRANQMVNQIQILDITGKVVRSVVLDQNSTLTQLSVSDLVDGHYFIRLQAKNDIKTLRFVKQ
ncbi:MAG: M43 family zinc metalloprotease [Bacteroidota bacterium]